MSAQRGREVYRALRALARTDYGGNTGALLVVYAVEGFLADSPLPRMPPT